MLRIALRRYRKEHVSLTLNECIIKVIRKQDAVLIAVFIRAHAFNVIGELIKDMYCLLMFKSQ